MPFVIGRITDLSVYGFPGTELVRTAQQTVPGQLRNVTWINTDDLQMNPDAAGHYNAAGQIALGARFANEFLTVPEPSSRVVLFGGIIGMGVVGYLSRRRQSIPKIGRCVAVALVLGMNINSASAVTWRIMPVGDSITAGYTNATDWTIPFTFGYRGPLYEKLSSAGYNFQFVGASGEPWNYPFGESFGIPTVVQGTDLRKNGQDKHRGYGGATTSQILNGGVVSGSTNTFPGIAGMLNADNPDVVLLMVGTNGLADAINNIDPLIQTIVTTKPDAHLIVAQITPRAYYQANMISYNEKIAATVAKYAGMGNHVTMVDQYVNLLTNPNDPMSINSSLLCPDGAHLRPAANELLAQTWFEGIQAVVPVPEPDTMSLFIILGIAVAAWRLVRKVRLLIVLAVCLLMPSNVVNAAVRIMPLGDSITAGTTDPKWKTPFSFGYRGHLYERLTNAGYDFQFVGASPEPWNGAPYGVPPVIVGPDLRKVGQDGHCGYGGSTTDDILKGNGYDPGIVATLNANNPDIVLLMIGINSIAQYEHGGIPTTAEDSLHSLVDAIFGTKAEVKLIVAQIHPYADGSLMASVVNYDSYITDTLVPSYAAQGYHISTVNQYANFVSPTGIINASLYSNIIHPNTVGYELMANTWYEGVQSVMQAPEPDSIGHIAMMGFGLGLLGYIRGRSS
jgi:lysophospholipase L1-like esterase